jgi:hypothetical protein
MPSGLPKKKPVPPSLEKDREAIPPRLQQQIDASIGGHRTSASMINAVVGGIDTKGSNCFTVVSYEPMHMEISSRLPKVWNPNHPI